MNRSAEKFNQNKSWLYFSLAAVFLWGLLAHGYGFLHSSFSHDSLNEFNGADGGSAWKIQLGRFVVPLYRAVFRTELTLPWLIGVLSLVWIGLAVFLVIRLFQVESKGIAFLIAGIFTANITVTATAATYLHDYDCDMFALLCAVAAVYLWKNVHWGGTFGAICIALSLGIYQSYISVTVVLVLFVCILALLNEESFRDVFLKGLKAVGMLLLGGILYYIAMQIVLAATNSTLTSGDYNSLDKALELTPRWLVSLVFYGYQDCWERLVEVISPYPAGMVKGMTLLLGMVVIAAIVIGLCSKKVHWLEKMLCIVLVGLIPLGMNLTYVLTTGVIHDLMVFAIWLFYLLALLLADWLVKRIRQPKTEAAQKIRNLPKTVSMILVAVILYGNVQTANAVYLKKDMEHDAFLSMMTRVVYAMEDYDAYQPGETPVVFVGLTDQLNEGIPGFEKYRKITGMDEAYAADTTTNYRIQRYFSYVLNNPAILAGNDVWDAMQTDPRVNAMPCYPEDGCISLVDGVLVVKLGNNS